MAEMIIGDCDADVFSAETKLSKSAQKDAKNKHKLEARRKIDDLMEQKRLRKMLDIDDDDDFVFDYT